MTEDEKSNGYDIRSWHELFRRVTEIDARTQRHEECFETMRDELSTISRNTGVVAEFFAELRQDNRELSRMAAGKNQVPLYLFVLFVVFAGVFILADKVQYGRLDIKIPWLGVELTHGSGDGVKEEHGRK